MTELEQAIQHHVEEEETEMPLKARRELPSEELDELGTKFKEAKRRGGITLNTQTRAEDSLATRHLRLNGRETNTRQRHPGACRQDYRGRSLRGGSAGCSWSARQHG